MSGKDSRIAVLATLVLAATGAACDKVPLLAPTSSTITVNASTRTLPLGGSTEISAVVLEGSGTPVQNGTTVTFSTSLGSVTPIEAQTRNGVATTTFNAGMMSGEAVVRANSGAAGGGTGDAATNTVRINVGAAAAAAVQVSGSTSSVPPTGGTVTIVAVATDASGNRLPGVPMTFSTTAGTLSSSSATTDPTTGEARVTLTTNQAATVTARAGNQTGTFAITLAAASGLTLATAPNPSPAGTPTTLNITAVTGTPTVTINWGDGNTENLGIVAGNRSVNHVYNAPAIYTITASGTGSAGDSFTTSTTHTVSARTAPTITPTPTTGTTSTTFSFTVTPAATASGVRNVTVNFGDGGNSEDLGAISGPTVVTHRYSSAGTYVARATQTDNSGGSSTGTAATVTVTP
jgi:adhesin/invasin